MTINVRHLDIQKQYGYIKDRHGRVRYVRTPRTGTREFTLLSHARHISTQVDNAPCMTACRRYLTQEYLKYSDKCSKEYDKELASMYWNASLA